MISVVKAFADRIEYATSDDGRVQYQPLNNDRLLIDGRDAWRGLYLDPTTCRATAERVDEAAWGTACGLMAEVDTHNRAVDTTLREADYARQHEQADREAQALARLRGFEEDN